jgi:hypothetical protein
VNPAPVVKAKDVASARATRGGAGAEHAGRAPRSQKRRRGEVFRLARRSAAEVAATSAAEGEN